MVTRKTVDRGWRLDEGDICMEMWLNHQNALSVAAEQDPQGSDPGVRGSRKEQGIDDSAAQILPAFKRTVASQSVEAHDTQPMTAPPSTPW